jgi:hypothetical protein
MRHRKGRRRDRVLVGALKAPALFVILVGLSACARPRPAEHVWTARPECRVEPAPLSCAAEADVASFRNR